MLPDEKFYKKVMDGLQHCQNQKKASCIGCPYYNYFLRCPELLLADAEKALKDMYDFIKLESDTL